MDTLGDHNSSSFSNNINTVVFSSVMALFIFRRSYKSTTPGFNFIKGKLRSLGTWMLKLSLLSLLTFCITITILSTKVEVNRSTVELTHTFGSKFLVNYKNYTIDIAFVMLLALKTAEILLTSSIFILVSLLIPSANSVYNKDTQSYVLTSFHSSIASFSKIWGIFRIPILFYCDINKDILDAKLRIFIYDLLSTVEFFTAGFFLLILNSKNSGGKSNENLKILTTGLFLNGIFKYAINLVDFPVELTDVHTQLISCLQFCITMSLYLLSICMFCPLKKCFYEEEEQVKIIKKTEILDDYEDRRPASTSMIEFNEKLYRN